MIKFTLKLFLTIACSFGLIVCTAQNDTTTITIPKGYVIISNDGFRTILTQRIDLLECSDLMKLKNKEGDLMQSEILNQGKQIIDFKNVVDLQTKDIKKLKKKVVIKSIEVWVLRFAIGFLTYKYIIK